MPVGNLWVADWGDCCTIFTKDEDNNMIGWHSFQVLFMVCILELQDGIDFKCGECKSHDINLPARIYLLKSYPEHFLNLRTPLNESSAVLTYYVCWVFLCYVGHLKNWSLCSMHEWKQYENCCVKKNNEDHKSVEAGKRGHKKLHKVPICINSKCYASYSSKYETSISFPSEKQCLFLSTALSFTAWTGTWISSTNINHSKYLLHHDMVGLTNWCNANLTSSATQSICATMCYGPFDCICKLVNSLNLDGSLMENTKPQLISVILSNLFLK